MMETIMAEVVIIMGIVVVVVIIQIEDVDVIDKWYFYQADRGVRPYNICNMFIIISYVLYHTEKHFSSEF